MEHWAMAEVVNGVYYSERCRLIQIVGGDCCEVHCPTDEDYTEADAASHAAWLEGVEVRGGLTWDQEAADAEAEREAMERGGFR